ncbi:MAG: GIY-YIG nuclease family protein [Candidatus Paceibacterota bacterium]
MYFVYMIKNSVNKLYVGITKNPGERLQYHNSKMGASFTKYASTSLSTGIPDFKIVFLENYQNMAEARRREIQIKKWRREKKEMLIERHEKGLSTNPKK